MIEITKKSEGEGIIIFEVTKGKEALWESMGKKGAVPRIIAEYTTLSDAQTHFEKMGENLMRQFGLVFGVQRLEDPHFIVQTIDGTIIYDSRKDKHWPK